MKRLRGGNTNTRRMGMRFNKSPINQPTRLGTRLNKNNLPINTRKYFAKKVNHSKIRNNSNTTINNGNATSIASTPSSNKSAISKFKGATKAIAYLTKQPGYSRTATTFSFNKNKNKKKLKETSETIPEEYEYNPEFYTGMNNRPLSVLSTASTATNIGNSASVRGSTQYNNISNTAAYMHRVNNKPKESNSLFRRIGRTLKRPFKRKLNPIAKNSNFNNGSIITINNPLLKNNI